MLNVFPGKKQKIKLAAVGIMDAFPALRPVITKVIPPLYHLSNHLKYEDLLAAALPDFPGGYEC